MLNILAPLGIFKNAIEHVVDNHIRETISEPAVGGIVYCDLFAGTSEHSGVYIGNGEIIHLNSKGWIEKVDFEDFTSGTTALSIYTSCRGDTPVGNTSISNRAIKFEKDISTRNYNVLLDNCHQFSASCLNNDP